MRSEGLTELTGLAWRSPYFASAHRLGGWWLLGVLAAGGFEVHLLGEGREQAGLPFGLAGDGAGSAVGGEVEE